MRLRTNNTRRPASTAQSSVRVGGLFYGVEAMRNEGFIEIHPGFWYEEATGLPWTSKCSKGSGKGFRLDGPLKRIRGHAKGYLKVGIGKTTAWHRLVWEHFNGPIPEGMEIDHKDRDRMNCRISNLRLATHGQNSANRPTRGKHGRGVDHIPNQTNRPWRAKIRDNGHYRHLGSYATKREAQDEYDCAALDLHGEFATLNHEENRTKSPTGEWSCETTRVDEEGE